jgi:hypothetical protein
MGLSISTTTSIDNVSYLQVTASGSTETNFCVSRILSNNIIRDINLLSTSTVAAGSSFTSNILITAVRIA